MALQGPHHSAQKSTTTGMALCWMWVAKLLAETAIGPPVNRGLWQRPHFASRADLASGIRLIASQCGQTICRASALIALTSANRCAPADAVSQCARSGGQCLINGDGRLRLDRRQDCGRNVVPACAQSDLPFQPPDDGIELLEAAITDAQF